MIKYQKRNLYVRNFFNQAYVNFRKYGIVVTLVTSSIQNHFFQKKLLNTNSHANLIVPMTFFFKQNEHKFKMSTRQFDHKTI